MTRPVLVVPFLLVTSFLLRGARPAEEVSALTEADKIEVGCAHKKLPSYVGVNLRKTANEFLREPFRVTTIDECTDICCATGVTLSVCPVSYLREIAPTPIYERTVIEKCN